jgi:hypothetical protein
MKPTFRMVLFMGISLLAQATEILDVTMEMTTRVMFVL